MSDLNNDIQVKQIMCLLCISNSQRSVLLSAVKKKKLFNKNMSCINKKSKSENSSLRNFAAFNSSSRCYNSCKCTMYVCYINTIPNTTLQVCACCIETSSNSLLKNAASDRPKTAFYKRQGAWRSSFPLSVVLNMSPYRLQNKYK